MKNFTDMEKERQYEFETIERCRNCHGSGHTVTRRGLFGGRYGVCEVCEGSGRVWKRKSITVRIKPYKVERDG